MAKIVVVWGLWGPYHCARLEAFRNLGRDAGHEVLGASLFSGSRVNQWRAGRLPDGVLHSDLGQDESRLPIARLRQLLSLPRRWNADVAFLPSYFHWSLALNASVRLAGGRVVMMNETHEGTARARGVKALLKKSVVSRFDAALVGGAPQKRYFASLGIPSEKIFPGYDAVDNDYFDRKAAEIRSRAPEVRAAYHLPEHYFLSLGRFVAKKNLAVLLQAYRRFLLTSPQKRTHLVLVGSGPEESQLRALCGELRLTVHDHAGNKHPQSIPAGPAVHFYGFRQIDENPVFYALADAFILPSRYEEWGLVVNEALASGLPVVVSETAGCAEDLLENVCPHSRLPALFDFSTRQLKLERRLRRNGFLFDPTSSDELSRILLLLDSSPDIARTLGKAGRRIVEKFSCRSFAENALKAATTALNGRPVSAAIKSPALRIS